MSQNTVPPPHPLVRDLVALEPIKTWSLIVTLFGDMVGDELTGRQVNRLLGHLGMKPETIRVALHRLKSDGWITSERRGREAFYALTQTARDQTQTARDDIYRREVKYPDGWRFVIPPQGGSVPFGAVIISKEVAMVPAIKCADLDDTLVLSAAQENLPQWVESHLLPGDLKQNARALVSAVQGTPEDLQELDSIAHRALVLHHWRRLALRESSWAHIGVFPDGVLARCHAVTTEFLAQNAGVRF